MSVVKLTMFVKCMFCVWKAWWKSVVNEIITGRSSALN